MTRLAIVIPVYNESEALPIALRDLALAVQETPGISRTELVLVDDGSDDDSAEIAVRAWGTVSRPGMSLHLVKLRCNQGHQRAILSGLRYLQGFAWDSCMIMDADGQDNPRALASMLTTLNTGCDAVFARRSERAEGLAWIIAYRLYLLIFRVLLGQSLPLGNFCLIRRSVADRLCREGDLMHLAATVATYPLRRKEVAVPRKPRSYGESKMRPWALVDYAVAAMTASVHAWLRLFTRLSVLTASVSVLGLLVVLILKVFTHLAISGWSSTICLITFGLSLQALGFMATTAFLCRILQHLAPMHVATDIRVLPADNNLALRESA